MIRPCPRCFTFFFRTILCLSQCYHVFLKQAFISISWLKSKQPTSSWHSSSHSTFTLNYLQFPEYDLSFHTIKLYSSFSPRHSCSLLSGKLNAVITSFDNTCSPNPTVDKINYSLLCASTVTGSHRKLSIRHVTSFHDSLTFFVYLSLPESRDLITPASLTQLGTWEIQK